MWMWMERWLGVFSYLVDAGAVQRLYDGLGLFWAMTLDSSGDMDDGVENLE